LIQVEEIAKVPGIDVLFIGPWDLGNNIGRPVLGAFHEDLEAAIERIRKAAVDNGKRAGIYCVGGPAAKKYADQGFHMVCSSLTLYLVASRSLISFDADLRRRRCCRFAHVPCRCP
jgi:2-keto-3-deoxy-L-rhamnonate aldolase RhmA